MKKHLLTYIILCITTSVFAQNLTFYGVLPALSQTGRITQKFDYNLFASTTTDCVTRTINNVKFPSTDLQLYIQSSVIFKLSPSFNFAGSYTYQRNNPLEKNYSNENRLWEQVIYVRQLGIGKMTHRVRFEERFIKNRVTGDRPLSTRLRYQIGYNRPLQGKTLDKGEFYFNCYNEFYFSLTGTKNATYSENWTYAGVGYNIGKMGKLELGYLYQVAVRNARKDLRFFNLCQVMWVTNFNCKKKPSKL